ncbi:hypothetical protein LEM8419_01034 [Neolewinella maritima]|uniref:Lipoprotein n=1 Tax=Neolewinella maritima TaxID=1383882 RepID=A0ABN8F6T4_9BACT|nr:hypothetical protein [Neolewinella maritima]CAH0999734.1 hypothetical protein LEM8419_01034 [Neolewinella maritima]
MKKYTRRLFPLFSLALLPLLSSCNRGFGCPTNLSVEQLVGLLFSWVG